MTRTHAWLVGGLLGVLCAPWQAVWAQAEAWRTTHQEHGITVSTRGGSGTDLSFRGQGKVPGAVLHVLAIILDDARATEWAKNADESKLLRTVDQRTQIVYSRSHQTWPVRDRDLVMKRTIEVVKPGDTYVVRLVCIAGERPKLPSVIRIGRCETTFTLRKVDAKTTHVDYQVRADPGGGTPEFLVRMASKDIPLDTLLALRKQLEKTKGKYAEVMRQWESS